jgi:hypothetical protein
MPDFWWHLNARRRRAADFVGALTNPAARDRRRREQFWKLAGRYASALTVRDRFGNVVTLNTADPVVSRLTFVAGSFAPANLDNLVAALAEGTHATGRAPAWRLGGEPEHRPELEALRFAPVAEDARVLQAYVKFFAPSRRQTLITAIGRLRHAVAHQ